MKVLATGALWLMIKVNLGLRYLLRRTRKDIGAGGNPNFATFQRQYFAAYFIAVFADWLQAPYLYKLYSSYGFEQEQIAVLYVGGLASAVVVGTWGTPYVVDSFGRKNVCMVFALIYSVGSLMNISSNYIVLLVGRVIGGSAASVLFASFEAWYLHEHIETHDFPREWMGVTFASTSYWSGTLSAVAGATAYVLTELADLGPRAPFVLAVPSLLACTVVIGAMWGENYGRNSSGSIGRCGKGCLDGVREVGDNKSLLLLGVIQSLFESVVYIFVFLWTPVLTTDGAALPLGIVFSTFMICTMIGSALAELGEKRLTPSLILLASTGTALASSIACAFFTHPDRVNSNACFFAYIIYECSVGAYFSIMGRLRQDAAPENPAAAAAALGWFRVPMNLIACVILMLLHDDSFRHGSRLIFVVCSALLITACLCVISYLPLDKSRRQVAFDSQPSSQ